MTQSGARPTPVSAVYVHAPFCARRCQYCDFAVTVRSAGDLPGWSDALRAELALVQDEGLFELAATLSSLYVGGGTPSLLGVGAMAALADLFGADRLGAPDLEWTAEANPESLTTELARGWIEAGLNRLSIGAQTFHEPALRWMGRLHGPDGPARAVEVGRAAGIDNISVDLIFGLPAGLGRSWPDDLHRALELEVPHLSLYGLTVEERTPLGRAVREGREEPVDPAQYEEEYLLAAETLVAAGYRHYEVSNFARPGAAARHNAVYWEGHAYLGLGNGAHSYAPPVRRWNIREWESYRRAAEACEAVEAEREIVGAEAARLEAVWLGLRTDRGVSLDELTAPPGASDGAASPSAESPPADSAPARVVGPTRTAAGRARAAELLRRWIDDGLATAADGRVRLTARGWLVLDRLAVDLDDALADSAPALGSRGSG